MESIKNRGSPFAHRSHNSPRDSTEAVVCHPKTSRPPPHSPSLQALNLRSSHPQKEPSTSSWVIERQASYTKMT
ncbi:hypothetical protein M407DRAFT_166962 [Tulasnella calospora MUT 4182]|uniref:Uncharacterized protein n=1 Tax=Tulasnella calospora MUT 4182 TaxID=1051891 RepID=A0A0C3L6R3_9AGAM|nr:hypothetical protein M407DRAFT_166962 [Tulasnella calospora MUT 4182]